MYALWFFIDYNMRHTIFNMPINKFVAVSTSIAALAFLLLHIILNVVTANGTGGYDVVINLIDYALLAISFILLLVMNLRNDDRAYMGITLLLTYIAIDAVFYFINLTASMSLSILEAPLEYILALILNMASSGFQLAMGICSYIFLFRYSARRFDNHRRIFLFLSLFVLATLLFQLSSLYLTFVSSSSVSTQWLISFIAITLALLCGGFSAIFTFKRLRRL